jgi:hypothetical protein
VLSVEQKLFRISWWTVNVLLLVSLLALAHSVAWEYSVRRYLSGFSDAIVPAGATPEERVEAILSWMRVGPPRLEGSSPTGLAIRNPENTLARSSDLQVRRLLLLTPDRNTKHVVAEVLLNGRWVVVDPTYRVILRNPAGEMVTLSELKNPQTFAEVIGKVPGYPTEYNYQNYAHVREARLPMQGLHLRPLLDRVFPGWDEKLDWSLLLERESFFVLTLSAWTTLILFLLRLIMGWYADRRLKIPRFHLRANLARAGAAFLASPEIK